MYGNTAALLKLSLRINGMQRANCRKDVNTAKRECLGRFSQIHASCLGARVTSPGVAVCGVGSRAGHQWLGNDQCARVVPRGQAEGHHS